MLAKAHERRNIADYEGYLEVDEQLFSDMIAAAENVYAAAVKLGPIAKDWMPCTQ
ncbi:MAG: hypothetical protein ABW096_19615 [Candidatus Thiodiazotropha sp.]